jgi:hypothetical protein
MVISFILSNGFENPGHFIRNVLASFIGITVIVTVNLEYLLPRLYFQKRHAGFILCGIALLVLVGALLYSGFSPLSEWFTPNTGEGSLPRQPDEVTRSRLRWRGYIMPLVIAFLGSTLAEITRYANAKEKEAIRSEKEKLETELRFLKSQINPHFLFNALNNIYSLTIARAEEAPESVMQLSEILRYMVYDSNEDKVPLKNEITYIENYVNLKLLKDSRGMNVQLNIDKAGGELMIPPLLFISFVENAFKHSQIENLQKGYIRISLQTNGSNLTFSVTNSLPTAAFTKDKLGGVGLANIKKRLDLLYPNGQYDLTINHGEQEFGVWLQLFPR